ncbi:MAG: gamma-glutamyltransferase [Pirellulales bacterium]|nr:gamma-glutamyltransferase [Pirellulales bacterium]
MMFAWRRRLACVLSVACAGWLGVAATAAEVPAPVHTVRGDRGMVVSVSPLATQVGVDVLRRGGSAVDAAVAVALALAVVWPEAGNIGGGGFMLVQPAPGAAPVCIEYRETAPAAATPDMFAAGTDLQGHEVVGVPGTVAGLALAHERFGRLAWRELVEPAVKLAREGFVLDATLAGDLNKLLATSAGFAELQRVYGHADREPWRAGDRLVLPDLAATLEQIADQGRDAFYQGRIAEALCAEMRAGGGLLTATDLVAYRAQVREPIHGTYRGWDIYGPPPPSSGGIVVVTALNILERFDLRARGRWSVDTVHLITEAMRRAYADRARWLGDPDFVRIPAELITKDHAQQLAADIDLAHATPSERLAADLPLAGEGESTTHFSIVDSTGMAVANTYTLEESYGSRVVVRGAGFLLNNEMTDFNRRPGYTDRRGAIGTPANVIAPGKRMLSSQSPTLVLRDGRTRWITGSPGGRTIPNTVLSVLLGVLEFEEPLDRAVAAPRLHHAWFPNRLLFEGAEHEAWQALVAGLRERGHDVAAPDDAQGDAHSIQIADDLIVGVADGRRAEAQAAGLAIDLPELEFPNWKIAEVYAANWSNTLAACREPLGQAPSAHPHTDPQRPWRVDVAGHYPGWYPGVDVKHLAAAYLATAGDLPRVLRAWDLTTAHYQMPDGGIRPSTMQDNPQGIWPETTVDGSVVFYPLRTVATIDYLLLADLIYRYSQDRDWLAANIDHARSAARFLEGWIDPDGLLYSHSYDLDQVDREIDGVAQASACLAFRKLAELETVLDQAAAAAHALAVAERLTAAARKLFWDDEHGYFVEHLVYNNLAAARRNLAKVTASSQLDAEHDAAKACDGVLGIGVDAFGVGIGAGGRHEWAANGESLGAWLRVDFAEPQTIGQVLLVNRTDPQLAPGERFAAGRLEFSDGSRPVEVEFNDLGISRAVARFSPRRVSWVRFVGTQVQGAARPDSAAGLAEFLVLPTEEPYRAIAHGMTDTNFAMVGFEVATVEQAARVWHYFRAHEAEFYQVGDLRAPTWIAERADTYGPAELNKRAPFKDCVAMGRTWRYDVLMRRHFGDGAGIVRTLDDAHALFNRPSGGGVGYFAERYQLGRFQPGDEAMLTVPKYAEYPAVYNSTVVQEALLGLSIDTRGVLHVQPCVPDDWYDAGFGQQGCGVLAAHRLTFHYRADHVEGTLAGPAGSRQIDLLLPPQLRQRDCRLTINGREVTVTPQDDSLIFALPLAGDKPAAFVVRSAR